MSKRKSVLRNLFNFVIVAGAAAMIVYLIIKDMNTFVNILTVMLGFGAVIMIHEFGHFIVAKLSGIQVDAFSIGFPPTLLGIKKTPSGMKFRFLPGGGDGEDTTEKDGDTKDKEHDGTEYQLGLIPFGGFVKMLGQEDAGAAEATDDPASFSNKPIIVRVGVVAAGVIFNAISAVLIFMTVFLIGVDLSPAVVGQVRPGSPAQIAGLRAKDEIVSVGGERFVDFSNLPLAAALSGKTEAIHFTVKRPGETEEIEMDIVAQDAKGVPMRSIGITQAETLTIAQPAKLKDVEQLYELTGLRGGDIVKAFDGQNVSDAWHLKELVSRSLSPAVVVTVERTGENDGTKLVNIELPLYASHTADDFKDGYKLANIYSIVPRLKIMSLRDDTAPKKGIKRMISFVQEKIFKKDPPAKNPFKAGDIILKAGDIESPTFTELREVTKKFADKAMDVEVLRMNESSLLVRVSLTAFPRSSGRDGMVTVGIIPSLDMENPIVAKTIDIVNGPAALEIPEGATITSVDGYEVANFYDVMRIIRNSRGEHINIEYRINDENAGAVALNVPSGYDHISAENEFAAPVPENFSPTGAFMFKSMTRSFKADGAGKAIKMGLKKTHMFIAQTYVTLQRLATRDVSPKTLVGPVGIVTLSYKIVASQSLTYYVYFLGLISSVIAVMNLLPLPIVDGGVIVLLIIEKIKGSPVSAKVQEIISYVGLVLIISLFLWLTYNDIKNLFL